MSLVIGISNLAIGLAYVGLGLLSAWETISLHRYRGWSRFGIGFSLMAASCGPHHLVHGWDALQGAPVSWPMFAATLVGLPAGLTFVLLRFEAMLGGRGERWFSIASQRVVLIIGAYVLAAGGLAAWSLVQPGADFVFQVICSSAGLGEAAVDPDRRFDVAALTLLGNVFVAIAYSMVGWYLADTQVRRRVNSGAWSLSGVALAGVFFTCAQMHFIEAAARGSRTMLLFDLIGIPASVYFLWIVRQVHSDSVRDWNRRPLVGAAAIPARPSPWSGEGATR